MKKPFWLLPILLVLISCENSASYSRVSYEVPFAMATCGNIWNGNIYNPAVGPEGFVDYRGYFKKGYLLTMRRDFTYTLTYQVRNLDEVEISGFYLSSSVNSGKLILQNEDTSIELTWATYFQLRFDWDIISPDDGTVVHTVALLHSGSIFTD